VAFTVLTEAQAGAAEFGLDGLDQLKALFRANRRVVKGQASTLRDRSIVTAGEKLPTQFPAVRIELEASDERYLEIGAEDHGKRLITLTYTVTVMDRIMRNHQRVTRSHTQLADRMRAVISHNRTLDGFCENVLMTPARYGFFAQRRGYLLAARLTATATKRVDLL